MKQSLNMAALTWLHLSDLHACRPRSGWEAGRLTETLVQDLAGLQRDHGLRPDLIFFTGDAAFGHLGSEPGKSIEEQFREAGKFLDAVRRAFTPEVPLGDLFLVPGNHDVDRRKVSLAHMQWLDSQQDLDPVFRLIQDAGFDWQTIMQRLGPYLDFLHRHDLGHLLGDPQRALWATVREIHGLRVGLAGFNSAWSCGRNGERGKLWAAGRWQQGTLREKLVGADVSIALMHHPPDWLVEHETPALRRELRRDFKFLLHGHEHQDWVESGDDGFTTIAAGACYDRSDKENGYNLVRLDLETGRGEVFLRRYDKTGGGWVLRPLHGQAPQGVRPLDLPWMRGLRKARTKTTPPPWSTIKAPPEEDKDLVHYLERLRAAHRDLPIAGFATRVRLPIRLDSVYVPLRARVMHHAMENEHKKGGTFRDPAFGAGEDREVPFDAALSLAREHAFRGAVVLGDPGTGKTTLLKHFVLAATDPAEGPGCLDLPSETVPVLLELRRLGAPAAGLLPALMSAIERVAPGLDAAAFATRLLRRDHLLVLVDGLDEIADAVQRAEVSRWLEEAAGILPHSVFVVTSRYAGYKGDARLSGRFLELHVRDLTEGEARRFLRDWYGAVEAQAELDRAPEVAARLGAEAADDLALRIFTDDDPRTVSLRELATNPLLLQILCLVHRDRKRLPERRVDLYGECCVVLLQLWREAKGMPVVLTAAQALKLLQPLAWWLHTQGRKEAGTAEILPLLVAPLRELGRNPEEGEALLEAIRDQSGLLVNVGPAFAFLHLSFQEYLSARHVQDQVVRAPNLLSDLAGHFGETWWREVILLAVGLDNPGLFEPLLSTLLGLQFLQRDVRLADDLLRDASAMTPRPLLEALAAGIASAQERYHALRLLRAIPGWDAEPLPGGIVGKTVVRPLLTDPDPQAAGMAAELLGERSAPRRSGRGKAEPGEERLHEVDGTVLLYVPGGKYTLGAEYISQEEEPVHRVLLSPFWIAKYPATNEQYGRFLDANPSAHEPEFWNDKRFNQPQQPVVGVSWGEAEAYCRWAGLRLPSEAQWEAAARGTDGRRYPWGQAEPAPEHANFGGREGGTTPVGSYPKGAGPFGALDQAGNVWEWCADVWRAIAYRERWKPDPLSTPTARAHADDRAVRCVRGGSWDGVAKCLFAAYRSKLGASSRHRVNGFRCLLPAGPEP